MDTAEIKNRQVAPRTFPVMHKRGKSHRIVRLFESHIEFEDRQGNSGRLDLDQIQSMRLNFAPATEYGGYHHVCELRTRNGERLHFRADEGMEAEQKGYKGLVLALHAHFLAQRVPPAFRCGLGNAWIYRSILAVLWVCLALLEVAVFVGTARKGNYVMGAIFLVLIPVAAYYLTRFVAVFARPGTYDPRNPSQHLLPSVGLPTGS